MSTVLNIYECPNGCKAQGGKPIASSIRGWKKHMTRNHGGYDQSQLDAILGTSAPDSSRGRELFLSEIDSPNEPAQAGTLPDSPASAPASLPDPERETRLKKEAMARKFSAKLNKFKEKVSARLADGVNLIAKDKGPEWEITEDDRELLGESIENCFEILDVDFQIRPLTKTLENPLWVLALPIIALVMIFLPKVMRAAAQKKEDDKETTN